MSLSLSPPRLVTSFHASSVSLSDTSSPFYFSTVVDLTGKTPVVIDLTLDEEEDVPIKRATSSPVAPVCPVCLDALTQSVSTGGPTKLKCGHIYHSGCIDAWVAHCLSIPGGIPHCPFCRTAVE